MNKNLLDNYLNLGPTKDMYTNSSKEPDATVGYLTQNGKEYPVELSPDGKTLAIWFQYDMESDDCLEIDVDELRSITDNL